MKIEKTAFALVAPLSGAGATPNVTGKFLDANDDYAPAICSAGFLVKKREILNVEGYTNIKSGNNWSFIEAESTDLVSTAIYACNPYEVNQISDGSNVYRVGANTLGVALPAGAYGTFTQIIFDGNHIYRFGEGNLSQSISTHTYLTIANGLLVPSANITDLTDGAPYFMLIRSGRFTEGPYASFTYYDVLACTNVE